MSAHLIRSILSWIEIPLAGVIFSIACATSRGSRNDPIPAVVVGRRTEPPGPFADIRYFLSLEFDDTVGVHRSEEVEVDWREFLYLGNAREACVIDTPGQTVRVAPCR